VTPYVPRPLTSGAKADGRFGKEDFVYLREENAIAVLAGTSFPGALSNQTRLALILTVC
jgi:transposase